MHLEILYIDNHLVVANKPAHLLTQSSDRKNLEDMIKDWIKNEYDKKGNVFLHAIHRLDKEVSGLVLFARTSKALSRLNEQMRERQILKTYVAWISGFLDQEEGELIDFLKHGSQKAFVTKRKEKGAKRAHLSYQVIKKKKNCSYIRIQLHTGRYHQIRAQFSHFGHPILGDVKYGSLERCEQIYLHHEKLECHHPTTKKKMEFVSLPPF